MSDHTGLHLGIDATNIRQGGGLTHLSRLLAGGDPTAAGLRRVTLWACRSTAAALPDRAWLDKRSAPWMDASLPRRVIGQQLALPAQLAEAGCDVLFSPGGSLPIWCPVPAVALSQNMLPFEPLEAARFGRWSAMRLKMWVLRHIQSRSFRRADGIIFLTRYAQTSVSRALGGVTALTALIPHGVEARFRAQPRTARPLSDCSVVQPFRVIYVSILMPYKHQFEVARAASLLRAEGIPVEMRFIGAAWGSYGRRFKALLKSMDPRGESLFWSGEEPFDALHRVYQNADAFVFASSCENLPNILIEAMAAGLPIASSSRGPMPEVLGDAGVYFDPESHASIAAAIRQIAQDVRLREAMATSAWRKATAYSWERCASDTFLFIAHVAEQRKVKVHV